MHASYPYNKNACLYDTCVILDVLHVLIISESVLMVMFCNVSIQLDQLTNIVPCKDLWVI